MLRFGINFFSLKTNQNPNFTDVGTLALIVSGFSLTFGHIELIKGCRLKSLYGIFTTVLLGLLFTYIQYIEYTNSTFSINDSVFGSIFFMFTGFHGLHVIIGTLFLFVCFIRHAFYHFTVQTHVGLDCASWYWHFVDVVWILVYLCFYYHIYLGTVYN
jgi:heme/copper-type cytochrome/quinol oxidase subunit 3